MEALPSGRAFAGSEQDPALAARRATAAQRALAMRQQGAASTAGAVNLAGTALGALVGGLVTGGNPAGIAAGAGIGGGLGQTAGAVLAPQAGAPGQAGAGIERGMSALDRLLKLSKTTEPAPGPAVP